MDYYHHYFNKKIMLPKLQNVLENYNYHIVWKLWIRDPLSDSYIKFTIKTWMEVNLTDYEYYSFICNYLINIKFNYRIQI